MAKYCRMGNRFQLMIAAIVFNSKLMVFYPHLISLHNWLSNKEIVLCTHLS